MIRKALPYQPTSGSELNSLVMVGMAYSLSITSMSFPDMGYLLLLAPRCPTYVVSNILGMMMGYSSTHQSNQKDRKPESNHDCPNLDALDVIPRFVVMHQLVLDLPSFLKSCKATIHAIVYCLAFLVLHDLWMRLCRLFVQLGLSSRLCRS